MSTIYGTDGNVYETGIRGTTNSENKLIIEQLNKFGRVPQTYELLQMINQLEQENKKLKDNWNKLKEYIKETKLKEFEKSYGNHVRYRKTFTQAELIVCNMITSKMQELEGSDSDE